MIISLIHDKIVIVVIKQVYLWSHQCGQLTFPFIFGQAKTILTWPELFVVGVIVCSTTIYTGAHTMLMHALHGLCHADIAGQFFPLLFGSAKKDLVNSLSSYIILFHF